MAARRFAIAAAALIAVFLYSSVQPHAAATAIPAGAAADFTATTASTTAAATAAATATTLTCSVYAGPLRWRKSPRGAGAPTQQLRALADVAAPLAPPPLPLRPFATRELRLLDGSPFASAARTNARFLKQLSQPRLFFSFRRTAGLAQPQNARPYGGWEGAGAGIRGHFVGHYLSALAYASAPGDDAPMLELAAAALRVLEACQRAHTAKGDAGYLAAFPTTEFDKVETLTMEGAPWVPHYASHKVLAGLLALHEALPHAPAVASTALALALGMASWIWRRGRALLAAKGEAHWSEGLNYEVGALSEVYVGLARRTHNASWLEAAALFDRRCFTGPLALAGALHDQRGGGGGGGGVWAQAADEATAPAAPSEACTRTPTSRTRSVPPRATRRRASGGRAGRRRRCGASSSNDTRSSPAARAFKRSGGRRRASRRRSTTQAPPIGPHTITLSSASPTTRCCWRAG